MSELATWVKDLDDDADSTLGLAGGVGKALFTSVDLCVLFYNRSDVEITKRMSTNMGIELRNRGFKQANDGKPTRSPHTGKVDRYWIIRQREDRWDSAKTIKHLRMHM